MLRLSHLLHQMKILDHEIQEVKDIFHEHRCVHFIDACHVLQNPDQCVTNNMKSAVALIEMCYLIENVGRVYEMILGDIRDIHKLVQVAVFLRNIDGLRRSNIAIVEIYKSHEP